jgi:hypothetical protein
MIRIALVGIVIMIGLAVGLLVSGNSKTAKKVTSLGKTHSSHYITPSGPIGTPGSEAGGELKPLVASGEQPQGTTPQGNLAAEMEAAPYDLIPQHQQAYLEKLRTTPYPRSNDKLHQSERALNQQLNWEAPMPTPTLVATRNLVGSFLPVYETFRNNESLEEYEHRLEPFVVPQSLSRIAKRKDNHQPKAIGLASNGGSSGSRVCDPYNSVLLDYHVIAYSGSSAYVTTEQVVCYTGPNAIWSGAIEERTYGIILEYGDGKWLVARCASDTLTALS